MCVGDGPADSIQSGSGGTGMDRLQVDVAIVGAGLAGLTAAHRLTQAGVGSLVVLEAKETVGGRTMRVPLGIDDASLDGGGELIGPGQDAMYRLLGELGIGYFETHFDGLGISVLEGVRGTFSGSVPEMEPDALAEFERAAEQIDALATTVPPEAPWNAPNAGELDRQSLASWLDLNVASSAARKVLVRKFANATGIPASQLSFLYCLTYLAGCGLLRSSYSAATHRIAGGAYRIAETLAPTLGDRVRTATPVHAVDLGASDGVTLHARGVDVVARRVIVAAPPGDCRSMIFQPALSAQRALLHGAWRAGSVYKFQAVYREPFWRKDGYSGYAYLDLGAIPSVYDASPPDGSYGILMLWVMPYFEGPGFGDPAVVYSDAQARSEAVLRLLASWFGPAALDPLTCVEKDWVSEPYSLGCGCGTVPGVLTTYGPALREPVGRLHWASSETAVHWSGYMNGAIESGERAASEVLSCL